MELPREFLARMKSMLGGEYEDFLRTYEEPRRFGLRVNTRKISVEDFVRLVPFHLRAIPWTDNGFYYEREDDPARHPFYYAGLYYLQEPSAMLPAQVLPVSPGERVLDLCAAPGGKATALAAKLQGQGVLVANEISASRAKALLKNLEVSGVTNSFVTNTTANRLAQQFPEYFDKILVDAPCSGEGMFRKDAANAKAWSLDKVQSCAKIQREITRYAVDMLRPGGLLLYSTCTFAPEEDEGTVACLLSQCPELELLEIPGCEEFQRGNAGYLRILEEQESAGILDGRISRNETLRALRDAGVFSETEHAKYIRSALSECVRLFPHRCDGEGHFLALFRKKDARQTDPREKVSDEQGIYGSSAKAVWSSSDGNRGRNIRYAGDRKPTGDRSFVGNRSQAGDKNCVGNRSWAGGRNRAENRNPGEGAALMDFLKDVSTQWDPQRFELRSGQAYYVPEALPSGGGLPFLRNGLYLGETRGSRFEPSQSLAMALEPGQYAATLDFAQDDDRVYRYLRGETVQVDDLPTKRPSGWQLVCVCGYPLGWGKLVNGTLKNKYHSGWRMQI